MSLRKIRANKAFSRVSGAAFTAALLMFLTACTSYVKVYRKIDNVNEKKYFEYLIYWVDSDRLDAIFEMEGQKMAISAENEVKKIAEDRGLDVNTFKKQQLMRVRHVNMRFGTYKKGMFTDRGRIYIKYGEPDETKKTEEDGIGEVEQWKYSQYGVEFIFIVDETSGEYMLVNLEDDRLGD